LQRDCPVLPALGDDPPRVRAMRRPMTLTASAREWSRTERVEQAGAIEVATVRDKVLAESTRLHSGC